MISRRLSKKQRVFLDIREELFSDKREEMFSVTKVGYFHAKYTFKTTYTDIWFQIKDEKIDV